jgi:hypothetical protein
MLDREDKDEVIEKDEIAVLDTEDENETAEEVGLMGTRRRGLRRGCGDGRIRSNRELEAGDPRTWDFRAGDAEIELLIGPIKERRLRFFELTRVWLKKLLYTSKEWLATNTTIIRWCATANYQMEIDDCV